MLVVVRVGARVDLWRLDVEECTLGGADAMVDGPATQEE